MQFVEEFFKSILTTPIHVFFDITLIEENLHRKPFSCWHHCWLALDKFESSQMSSLSIYHLIDADTTHKCMFSFAILYFLVFQQIPSPSIRSKKASTFALMKDIFVNKLEIKINLYEIWQKLKILSYFGSTNLIMKHKLNELNLTSKTYLPNIVVLRKMSFPS